MCRVVASLEKGGFVTREIDPTIPEGVERIVCVLTGHGLKDPQTALEQAGTVVPCEPEFAAVERAVLG